MIPADLGALARELIKQISEIDDPFWFTDEEQQQAVDLIEAFGRSLVEQVLREYGQHKPDCVTRASVSYDNELGYEKITWPGTHPCSCGLSIWLGKGDPT